MKGALAFVGARWSGFSEGKNVVSGGYYYTKPFLKRNPEITNEDGRSEVVCIVQYKGHSSVVARDRGEGLGGKWVKGVKRYKLQL